MKENYPLINLIKSEQPPFWVYNNYAYVYHQYLESYKKDTHYYVMGDCQKKPKLDESLEIKLSSNPNLKGIYFIENESFEWVEQVYYGHINELETFIIHNWKHSVHTINCFSAKYEFKKSETGGVLDNDEIYNIEVYDFESAGLYPDNVRLNFLAKNYLKKIISTDLENFLNFHFNSCYDAFKFLVHVIEITDGIWGNSSNEFGCKKVLKKWIKEKIKFLEISNPQVLIDIYQKKIKYYEKFITMDSKGIITFNGYDDSYSNTIPFEFFYNNKLEVKIYEFFQLNEKPTPEPPQAVVNNEIEKLKVLCDPSTFGYIITQLFENGYIDLPKRQGDLNFSATARQIIKLFDLNTTEEYLANCLNENKNTLSDFTKRTFDIKPYENKKPSK